MRAIYSIAEMVRDPHFNARGLFEEIEISQDEKLKIPRVLPLLSETPGRTEWLGPPLGAHNEMDFQPAIGLVQGRVNHLRAARRHLINHPDPDNADVYPVPQNALYVSAGMNVLKFLKGKP